MEKPKKQVSMNSTKKPLYKKKYHAARQLYPKTRGLGSAHPPRPAPPSPGRGTELSDDNADRNGTTNGGEGLAGTAGDPSPQHGLGGPWHGPGPRAQSVLGTQQGPARG